MWFTNPSDSDSTVKWAVGNKEINGINIIFSIFSQKVEFGGAISINLMRHAKIFRKRGERSTASQLIVCPPNDATRVSYATYIKGK